MYLLDTHVFLWLASDSKRLSASSLKVINDSGSRVFISLVSIWELQIKYQLGKLQLRLPVSQLVNEQQTQNGLDLLSVTTSHIYDLQNLSDHHRDPFDRLLIAQARVEGMTLISQDAVISQYPVTILW